MYCVNGQLKMAAHRRRDVVELHFERKQSIVLPSSIQSSATSPAKSTLLFVNLAEDSNIRIVLLIFWVRPRILFF
jgi:hypothetical protein